MKRGAAITLLALSTLGLLMIPASAAPVIPSNDYGVMSPEVVKQRLRLAGYTEITNLVKTPRGYQATVMRGGARHVLEIDTVKGHILENGVKIRLPMTEPLILQPR
jgi:hypothetical protein